MKIEIEIGDIETTAKALNNAVAAFGDICSAIFMNCEVPAKFESLKSLYPEDLDFYADSYTHQFLASGAVIFFAAAIVALLLSGSALPSSFDSPGVHTVIADTMEFSQ